MNKKTPRGEDKRNIRTSRMQNVGKMLPSMTRHIFDKYGFMGMNIINDWPQVVGEKIASFTVPEKVAFPPKNNELGVLHLWVHPAFALEIQHEVERLIERVNGYYGYEAIKKIVIKQRAIELRGVAVVPKTKKNLQKQDVEKIASALEEVEDEELKERLESFGNSLFSRKNSKF